MNFYDKKFFFFYKLNIKYKKYFYYNKFLIINHFYFTKLLSILLFFLFEFKYLFEMLPYYIINYYFPNNIEK